MQTKTPLSQKLTTFEGVLCSGFLVPDQAMVTALALLFEKVHFLNQLEYVIELSKHYWIRWIELSDSAFERIGAITLTPIDCGTGTVVEEDADDPLGGLTPRQRRTVQSYLFLSDRFFRMNGLLFPTVFSCSLLPEGEVFSAKLIKKGRKGELNTYEVRRNPLTVTTGGEGELAKLLNQGCVPILGGLVPEQAPKSEGQFSPTAIATALAIKTIAMVLPATLPAESEVILEARERLREQLPLFWSSMLKLSVELAQRLNTGSGEELLQKEVDNAVATTVRPALIELVSKLEKERKMWFYRILSPLARGLRVLAGKPPTDLAGLLSKSLVLGGDVSVDVASQLRKVDALKQDSGLAYLIELHKAIDKPRAKRKSRS
ncbi:MAG: hypothetical protein JSV19_10445 [Phycisphaerales bacterium]|nr:MAG: hypothetical protein JSV19_10445 [Phycisphaerales bacterium]